MTYRLLIISAFLSTFGITFAQRDERTSVLGLKKSTLYESIEEGKRLHNKEQLVFSYTDLGKLYIEEGNYEQALNYLMKAKSYNKEDSAYLTPYYTAFGSLFSKIGAYSGAIEYEKKIFSQPSKSKLSRFYSASSIGWLYVQLNMMDSAGLYYRKQYELSLGMDDYMAVSSALNNQGLVLLEIGKYPAALKLFQQALDILRQNRNGNSPNFQSERDEFKYNVMENLGRTYYFLGNYQECIGWLQITIRRLHQKRIDHNKEVLVKSYLALSRIEEAKQLISSLTKDGELETVESKLTLNEIKLNYLLFINNLAEVKKTVLQINELQQELNAQKIIEGNRMSLMISRYLINEAKSNIEREKSLKKVVLKRLSVEKQQNTTYIFALVGTTILLSFSLVLYVQFAKVKKRRLLLETEKLVLNNEVQKLKIKTQESYLTEYALDFSKNKEYESTMIRNLQTIANEPFEAIPGKIKSLIAELRQKQRIDKRAEELAIDSENVLANFRYTLQEKHPELKKSEVQLCYLLRLELSNKEIAAIKNVTPNSIKIFKNRLKNKLNLPPEVSLTSYLNSI